MLSIQHKKLPLAHDNNRKDYVSMYMYNYGGTFQNANRAYEVECLENKSRYVFERREAIEKEIKVRSKWIQLREIKDRLDIYGNGAALDQYSKKQIEQAKNLTHEQIDEAFEEINNTIF